MKIVIAPDKFKGSLTGFEFCDAVAEGLQTVLKKVDIVKKPLADGGDGTVDVVQYYLKGEKVSLTVKDPLFRPIKASYLYADHNKIAFIEMAGASGLNLIKDRERSVMHSTSFGTGELIADAISNGAEEIILGIGGSATNDGGMGIAQALGFRFLDKNGIELQPFGRNLVAVKSIDSASVNPKLSAIKLKVACDVDNPFFGENGAAHVYTAQKGASKTEIELLDEGLRNYAKVLFEKFKVDVQTIPGSGAAGGVGGAAHVLLEGQLISGVELIKEIAHFDDAIADADWIITGEGKLDNQTLAGKTIAGILRAAQQKNIPVAALCGEVSISEEDSKTLGLNYFASISEDCHSLEEAILNAYPNLVESTKEFAQLVLLKN